MRASLTILLAVCLGPLPGCDKTSAASGPPTPPTSGSSPLLEGSLPEFSRRTLAGAQIDTGQLRGQVVVVKFFAEYCEPCKHTLPVAEQLHQKYPTVAFIGVSEDEYASTANGLVQSYGLSFPVVHDAGNVLSGRFRIGDMPVTFVADAQGTVRWVGGPGQATSDLERAILAYSP